MARRSYTAVGPFAFRRSKRNPNSIRGLRPVKKPSEVSRGVSYADRMTKRNARIHQNALLRKLARSESNNGALRKYYGLPRYGEGSRGNPLQDLLRGNRRLTTPEERKASRISMLVTDPKAPFAKPRPRLRETPYGFAVVGKASKRQRSRRANRWYEAASGVDTSKTYFNQKGKVLQAKGLTTLDESQRQLRVNNKSRALNERLLRKAKTQRERLVAEQRQRTVDYLSGNTKPKVAGVNPVHSLQYIASQIGDLNKEITDREGKKTAVEGLLTVVENLSRPYYGTMAGAKAVVQGQRPDHVLSHVGKGLALDERTEGWDVLDSAGVKNKYLKYGLGIPLSFAGDPLTYVSVGAAPLSAGASLAALTPKFATITKLVSKSQKVRLASKAASSAGKYEKAQRLSVKAAKIDDRVDKMIMQHGYRADLPSNYHHVIDDFRPGKTLRVGPRVPFTQRRLGFETSGRMTSKLRNEGIDLNFQTFGRVNKAAVADRHFPVNLYEVDPSKPASREFTGADKSRLEELKRIVGPTGGMSPAAAADKPRKTVEVLETFLDAKQKKRLAKLRRVIRPGSKATPKQRKQARAELRALLDQAAFVADGEPLLKAMRTTAQREGAPVGHSIPRTRPATAAERRAARQEMLSIFRDTNPTPMKVEKTTKNIEVPGTPAENKLGMRDHTITIRTPRGPRSVALRENWAQEMAPAGAAIGMTASEGRKVYDAAAEATQQAAQGPLEEARFVHGTRRAAADELGIGRVRQILRPFNTRRQINEAAQELLHQVEAGNKVDSAVVEYVQKAMKQLHVDERQAGLPTSSYTPASKARQEVLDDFAHRFNLKDARKEITGKADGTLEPRHLARWARKKYGENSFAYRYAVKQGQELSKKISLAPQDYVHRVHKSEIFAWAKKMGDRARRIAPKTFAHMRISRNPNPKYTEMRMDQRKLRDAQDVPGNFKGYSRDFIRNQGARIRKSTEDIAKAQFNRRIVRELGVKAAPGLEKKSLPEGISLYKLEDGRLTAAERVPARAHNGEYFLLKDVVKERADNLFAIDNKRGPVARAFDKTQGVWKGGVTVWWPGYYLRNLIGDTVLASQAGTDARSMRESLKINRAALKREKVLWKGKHISRGENPNAALDKLKIKINGETYTARELENLAAKHAATSGGMHAAEVPFLMDKAGFSVSNRANRFNIRRENLPRRATFIAGMKRGMEPKDAAAHARREHYDYGTRTKFQHTARRAFPFFTWWDLNTRKQLRLLVENPAQTTKIYHVLNGASAAAGFKDYRDFLSNLNQGQQRGLPLPVPVIDLKTGRPKIDPKTGKPIVKSVQFGNVLNELRSLTNPKGYASETLARFTPFIAKPFEYTANFSGFFRGPIQPDYAQRTNAPTFLGNPAFMGKRNQKDTMVEKLLRSKIVEQIDRRTGEYVPKYDKKADYMLRAGGPWANVVLGQLTKGDAGPFNRGAEGYPSKTVNLPLLGKTKIGLTDELVGLTGVSPSTVRPDQGELDRLFRERSALQYESQGLKDVKGGEKRRKKVNAQIDTLTNKISAIEQRQGYAIPLNASAKKKKGKKKSASSGGGLGGFGLPSGGGFGISSGSAGWGGAREGSGRPKGKKQPASFGAAGLASSSSSSSRVTLPRKTVSVSKVKGVRSAAKRSRKKKSLNIPTSDRGFSTTNSTDRKKKRRNDRSGFSIT